MAQETGTILKWFKAEGEAVSKGEPLIEVETDKITVELEAPASGQLANVTALAGDEVAVGTVIAKILAPGESTSEPPEPASAPSVQPSAPDSRARPTAAEVAATAPAPPSTAEYKVDLEQVRPQAGRVEKADVQAYSNRQSSETSASRRPGRRPASPKARRLAVEHGIEIAEIDGSGPAGAVLAADILPAERVPAPAVEPQILTLSPAWRVMAERTTQSWTHVPHFYLLREVNANRLISWREKVQKRLPEKICYTDLLLKLVAASLREHPQVNAQWQDGTIALHSEVNVGLAVAVEEGLIVPVIGRTDELSLNEIAARRRELVTAAQSGKLRLEDISGGTFTLSNLGMYGVDAFSAIVNPPQAAILAVGRIAQRVVPVDGQPAVQPMMMLNLSCDHRVVDGARGAQFLQTLVDLIEEPLGLFD
jgi:pyruvate dehydrogenase E2 component (dihydrolipoamide acetyltransferase)